jgi:hypothetical protein
MVIRPPARELPETAGKVQVSRAAALPNVLAGLDQLDLGPEGALLLGHEALVKRRIPKVAL